MPIARSIRFVLDVVVATSLAFVAPSVAAPPRPVVVETWNLRFDTEADGEHAWPRRAEAVLARMADLNADVVSLQEILPHQMTEIRAALPGHDGLTRSREVDPAVGEAIPLLWRRDRWRLDPDHHGHLWMSETPEVPGSRSWDAACTRMTSWARLVPVDLTTGDRPMWVYSTHFDHKGRQARREAARLLARHIANRPAACTDEPVIVMGDLNADPDSPPLSVLVRGEDDGARLVDAWAWTHPEGDPDAVRNATWNGFRNVETGRRIDFVLVDGFEIRNTVIDRPLIEGRPLSDHWPVRATLIPEG